MTRTLLLVVCAVALLAFLAGRHSGDRSAEVAALQARVDSLTRTRPAFTAAIGHTDTVVRVVRASASAYIRQADALKRIADSLHTALAYAKKSPDVLTSPVEAPRSPVGASDTSGATGTPPTETSALRGALAAQIRATAALTVALDTMTAARDSALRRVAVLEGVARQGVTVAAAGTTWRLGPLRLPRVAKWVTAVVGCAGGAYLDRQEPVRGCGLAATGLTLVVPTR